MFPILGHIQMLRAHAETGPWEILGASCDIARDGAPWENDFTTNYQGKFNEIGDPVFALQVRRGGVARSEGPWPR